MGNGDGTFMPFQRGTDITQVKIFPGSIVSADVNADGKPDLVAGSRYCFLDCGHGTLGVFLGR